MGQVSDYSVAVMLAHKYHAGQKYGDSDYTYHLDQVTYTVQDIFPGDERLLTIAQLHDILEDTVCTKELLYSLLDKDVVDAVIAITKDDEETREEYLLKVKSNELARKVKIADAYCNLSESMKRGHMKRIKKYGETLAMLAM